MLPSLARTSSRYLSTSASRTGQNAQRSINKVARASTRSNMKMPRGIVAGYRKMEVYKQSRSYYKSSQLRYAEDAKDAKEAGEEAAEAKVGLSHEDASKLRDELESTKKALEETAKALTEQKERLARSYADLENTVRIAKRDVANAKEFGIKGFAMKMFDLLDTVELCLTNLPKDPEPDSHLDSAIIALDSTKKQFLKVMGEYEVQPMETKVGDKFDANFHNAIFEMEAPHPDHPPSSVGAIIKQGWTRGGALLRPSHVGVVMKPHPSKQ